MNTQALSFADYHVCPWFVYGLKLEGLSCILMLERTADLSQCSFAEVAMHA